MKNERESFLERKNLKTQESRNGKTMIAATLKCADQKCHNKENIWTVGLGLQQLTTIQGITFKKM